MGGRALVVLTMLALVGCTAEADSPLEAQPAIPGEARQLSREEIYSEAYSGIADRRRLAIRSEDEWNRFWTEAMGPLVEPPPPPEVDFSTQMVLAATMGQRPTGGHGISIPTVGRDGERTYAVVLEVSPGPSCVTTQALTAPGTAVLVPRGDGEVTWIETTEVRDC